MEAESIYKSLESLRNELLAVSNGNHSTIDAKMDSVQVSVDEIKEHMRTLNGRTRKAETSVTRLNLVVFGIGGPSALVLLGVVLKLVFGVT